MRDTVQEAAPTVSHGRFGPLDAMRGVAALVVVGRHYVIETGAVPARFSSLAVDLFFVLSGFVIAYSYDPKFQAGLRGRDFLIARAKRLYPIYAVGFALSVAAWLIVNSNRLSNSDVLWSTLFGAFGLPTNIHDSHHLLFPLNAPFWSLFFEFWVANVIYGLAWRWLDKRALTIVIAVSALGLLVNERVFYTFDVGWSWANIGGGVVRVMYSFFVGVAISRYRGRRAPKQQFPAVLLLAVLLVMFFMPLQARPAHLFELIAVGAVFPALVYWGSAARERMPSLGRLLGNASYALYAVHMPLMYVGLRLLYGPKSVGQEAYSIPLSASFSRGACLILALAIMAWFIDYAYDRPLRRVLRSRAVQSRRLPTGGLET